MKQICFFLIGSLLSGSAWAAGEYAHGFAGGTGTSDDPYQIETMTHLSNLAFWSQQSTDFSGNYFVMTNDISYSDFDSWNMVWGIGLGNRPFSGCFNGNGHKITRITTGTPVFLYVGQNGVVKNLYIEGVVASGSYMLNYNTAPMVDHLLGLLENCHVTGIVHDYTSTSQSSYAGGLVGYLTQTGIVRNCTTSGQATVGCGYGGVVAKNYSGKVENCSSDMDIIIKRANIAVGGICGLVQSFDNAASVNVAECTFNGTISQYQLYDSNKAGGICGDASTANIHACVNHGSITSTGVSGGICGTMTGASYVTECYNMGLIQDYFMSQGQTDVAYNMTDFTAGIVGQISGGTFERCFNGGTLRSVRGAGGIIGTVGSGIGAEATITDCYNAGLIEAPNVWKTGNTTIQKAGGLVGEFSNVYDITISHCLSVGTLDNAVAARGVDCEYLGYTLSEQRVTLEGNYYDNQVVGNSSSQGGMSTERLTDGTPLDGLDPAVWLFETGFYPRLRCHDGQTASLLCATPYFLTPGETHTKVKNDFTVSDANGVNWTLDPTTQASLDSTTVHVSCGEQSQRVTLSSSLGGMLHQSLFIVYPDLFVGSGTADDPYLISDYADMVHLSQATNEGGLTFDGDYLQLASDIDMEGHTDFGLMSLSERTPFLGTLDGQGHALRGFYMRNDLTQTQNAGLFGYVGGSGVIKNLVIPADGNLGLYLGGGTIAAELWGTIENVLVLPRTIHSAEAAGNFGGIVNKIESTGQVIDCFVGADIALTGAANYVAGIARNNYGIVDGCQFAGNVGGPGASYIGGLVAENYRIIDNCLASGDVTGNAYVGGVASRCLNYGLQVPAISNTLATGQVTYATQVELAGAVLGGKAGTFDNVWYDSQIGLLDNVMAEGITGKLTREIINEWNGGDKWISDGKTYPRLVRFADQPLARLYSIPVTFAEGENRGDLITSASVLAVDGLTARLDDGDDFTLRSGVLTANASSTYSDDQLMLSYDGFTRKIIVGAYGQLLDNGDGTEANPWIINTEADLMKLASESNRGLTIKHFSGKHFKLGGDITLTEEFAGITGALHGNTTANAPRWFRGVIDGNGYAISNLNITSTNSYGLVGLVGFLGPDGVVKDLTITDGNVQGTKFVGSVVGKCAGTVTGIVNYAKVTSTSGNGSAGSGGVVGYVNAMGMVDCLTNYGEVTNTMASGICYTAGVIGTVVGNGNSTFCNLTNHGKVSGPMGVAGVVANSRLVSYDNVVNDGEIFGTAATSNLNGGCFGDLVSTLRVNNARNYASVNGSTGVGGVIARYITGPGQIHIPLEVSNCLNAGDITGKLSNVGGIVGLSDTTRIHVLSCANVGNITNTAATIAIGTPAAGGIVGGGSPVIEECYNAGIISGTNCIGGLLGRPVNNDVKVDIINSINVGWLEGYDDNSANMGAVAGFKSLESNYVGVAYDKQMCDIAAVGNEDIQGVTAMNTIDLAGENRMYDVPQSLAQDSDLIVSAMPVFLAQGDARWNVTRSFELAQADGAGWNVDSVFVVRGRMVNILPNTHGLYGVTATYGTHHRTIPLMVDFDALRGDVNADGVVDISDINIIINIMLGKDSADRYDGRAYVTEDNLIDVSDVNAIINIMLGKA